MNFKNNYSSRNIQISNVVYSVYGDKNDDYFNSLPDIYNDHDWLFKTLKRHWSVDKSVCVLDVGASIGLFTIGVCTVFKAAKVISFEPYLSAFTALKENKKCLKNDIVVEQLAITSKESKSFKFHEGGPINANRSSGSHLMNEYHWDDNKSGVSLSTETLDNYVIKNKIDSVSMIKIDVEGFEPDILEGAKLIIEKYNPIIFLEFNSWALMAIKNINPRSFIDYLGNQFKYVYKFESNGNLYLLKTATDRINFLHDNLIYRGCVDDLMLSNKPL